MVEKKVKNRPIYNYSWRELRQDAINISHKIGKGKFKFILAVSRGGLIPAYYIADNLDIKIVKTICLSSYRGKGNVRGPIVHHKVKGFLETIENPREWLVVDDLADSGHTLEYIKREYPAIQTAALVQKRTGKIKADYFGKEVDNIWVKMPFES